MRRCAERARGPSSVAEPLRRVDKYLVGCPDLIENMDVLSSLRGAQTLLMDMVERPEWVEQKIREINDVWFAAYQRIYDLIKLEDGSSAFGAFYIWGPGKVAKLQCDASAMFSPKMYQRFVVPALTAQCEWLDHSLYHLDGTQAMVHLDNLLAIEPLDAIEWTPQAGIETGGNQRWHDLYRRILAAGKSVQVVNVELDEVLPLLDAIGPKGVYMLIQFKDEREAEQVGKLVEPITRHENHMSRPVLRHIANLWTFMGHPSKANGMDAGPKTACDQRGRIRWCVLGWQPGIARGNPKARTDFRRRHGVRQRGGFSAPAPGAKRFRRPAC